MRQVIDIPLFEADSHQLSACSEALALSGSQCLA
jgi:hypothetical protein